MGSGGLPPGPRTPAAINTARLKLRPIESLVGWRERHGDVFTIRLLTSRSGVYICDPDLIRGILTGDQSDLLGGRASAPRSLILGAGSVMAVNGQEHKRQRRLLLRAFRGSQGVGHFRRVSHDVAHAEIGCWRSGEGFVLRDRMRAVTFEVTARALLGVLERDRIDRFRDTFDSLVKVASLLRPTIRQDPGRRGPWGWFHRRLEALDRLIFEEIAARRGEADLAQRADVLSLLLCARDEDGEPMTDSELRDALMTVLLAGHETTATCLAFAFDLLLRSPQVVTRLRDELASGDDAYLESVVAETLRLRPAVLANVRTLAKPQTIGGWDLPPGISVYPAMAVVHRREDLFPDADEFRPERFTEKQVLPYTWLPFGGGIRHCIGASLARVEMAEVIRTVITRVELELVRTAPEPVIRRGLTLVPRHGTPVRVCQSCPKPQVATGN